MIRADQERIKNLLTEAITLLCRNSLSYKEEVTVEGLIGITLDRKDIFLVSINETLEGNILSASGNDFCDIEELQGLTNHNHKRKRKKSTDSNKPKSSSTPCDKKYAKQKVEKISENEYLHPKIKTENDEIHSIEEHFDEGNVKEDILLETSNDIESKDNDIDSKPVRLNEITAILNSSNLPIDTPVTDSSVIHHTSSLTNISSVSIKQEEKDDDDDAFVIDSDDDDDCETDYDSKMIDFRSSSLSNNYPEGHIMFGSNFSDSDVVSNTSQFSFDPSDDNWQTHFDMSQVQSGSDGMLLNMQSNINSKSSTDSPRNFGQNWSLNINASSKHNWQLIKKFSSSESADCQLFISNHVTRNFRKSHTYRSGRYMVQLYRCKFKMKSNWYPCGCMIKLLFPHNSLECLIIHNGVEHIHKKCDYL